MCKITNGLIRHMLCLSGLVVLVHTYRLGCPRCLRSTFFMFSHLSHNNTEDAFPITKGLGLFFFSWQNFYAFWDFYIPLYVRSAKLGMFVSYLTWKCLFYGWPVWVSAGFWHFGHILMVSTALYGPKSIFCCRKIGSILKMQACRKCDFLSLENVISL